MNAKVDISKVILETKRTILRPFKNEDLDDFFAYASVPGVGERAGWHYHENKDVSKTILDKFILEKKTFAIVDKNNSKVIGSIGIEKYGNEDKLSEFFSYKGRSIGFALSKDYWNQGIMSEVLTCVIKYCFEELDYDFLLCGRFDENIASGRVQEKCGFIPYRRLNFDTKMGEKKPGVLNLLINPKKNIEFCFSHPETLIFEK